MFPFDDVTMQDMTLPRVVDMMMLTADAKQGVLDGQQLR